MPVFLTGAPRRIRGLIHKEFLQIIRDPSSILIAVILPLIMLFLFAYGISLDANHVRLGVAVERMTPEARDLVRSFQDSRYFEVFQAADRRELEPALMAGYLRGIVVIPLDFSKQVWGNGKMPIQIITDGSETNTANFVENYVAGVWGIWRASRNATNPLRRMPTPGQAQLVQRVWFNQQIESKDTLLPGAIPIIITLVGTLLTTLVVAREWDRGTMEALISTPVSITEILISKFIPYFILGMGTAYFCWLLATVWYHVPFRGSLFAMTLTVAIYLLNALGIGLFISSATKNQFAAAQAALFSAFLPAFLLSGYLYEISSMPKWVQYITAVFPVRYAVTALRTVFLAGDVWDVLLPCFWKMLLLSSLIYLLVASKTVKRLD
jgi:ABC-2 type transport system permease protein